MTTVNRKPKCATRINSTQVQVKVTVMRSMNHLHIFYDTQADETYEHFHNDSSTDL